MRLEKIKISGFKSFVDPTTVLLPSNLVGVIGPNGCGKSNVIDAVRWVMGESSAKMLRGESMADVIFNGSTSRKPVGAASVELVFDNADGTVGGEYAQYNQISIKRKVTRDGQSMYFLNGVRCRRRDITDIFLGTGLGPRSYSIIEQGMISRFVEAKPEDLRSFLEEAAGISKYKERRRETESRIAHTRENLERLTDLREEVAKQLQHLERQAATAEKYKLLKQEERQKKAELLALRLQALDDELEKKDRVLAESENQLQAIVSEQRRIESDLEKQREEQHDANDGFNRVQGQFYAVGADIARLEESIQYTKNARSQQQNDLQQVEQAWQEAQDHCKQDESRLAELEELLAIELPEFEQLKLKDEELDEILSAADQDMHNWQHEWDEFNKKATEPAQVAQVERTKINHIEQQEQQYQRRLDKIKDEHSRLDVTVFEREIDEFSDKLSIAEEQHASLEAQLKQVLEDINQHRQQSRENSDLLNQSRTRQQTAKGRLSSLEALQQDALGKKENTVNQWLDQAGLHNASRLLEKLTANKHWQTAVETVLAFHLQSVCLDDFDASANAVSSLSKGKCA
jgi:chromosome segregation protein